MIKVHHKYLSAFVGYLYILDQLYIVEVRGSGWRPGILTGEFPGYSPCLEANSGPHQTGHDHFRILSSLLAVIERSHFINVGSVKEKQW